MTLLEKAKLDGKHIKPNGLSAYGCPYQHGYETEKESFSFCERHFCDDCYAREYKEPDETANTPKEIPSPEKAITCESILRGAIEATCTDRNHQYGGPERSFTAIAEMWTAYMRTCGRDIVFNDYDVAMMLSLFKVARTVTSENPKADTYIDIAGYVACAGEIACRGKKDG